METILKKLMSENHSSVFYVIVSLTNLAVTASAASNKLNKSHLIPLILATPTMFKCKGACCVAKSKTGSQNKSKSYYFRAGLFHVDFHESSNLNKQAKTHSIPRNS